MRKQNIRYSPEFRERAVRLVMEGARELGSQWAAIVLVSAKIGCGQDSLRRWVREAEPDSRERPGPSTEERERIRVLEREVRELRQANEILRKASAYIARAELDRPYRP